MSNVLEVPKASAEELLQQLRERWPGLWIDERFIGWNFHQTVEGMPIEGPGLGFEPGFRFPNAPEEGAKPHQMHPTDVLILRQIMEERDGRIGHVAGFMQTLIELPDLWRGAIATLPPDVACWHRPEIAPDEGADSADMRMLDDAYGAFCALSEEERAIRMDRLGLVPGEANDALLDPAQAEAVANKVHAYLSEHPVGPDEQLPMPPPLTVYVPVFTYLEDDSPALRLQPYGWDFTGFGFVGFKRAA